MVLSSDVMFQKRILLRDKTEISLEQLTGKERAREFQLFINKLILERAYLIHSKQFSLAEEKKWFAKEIAGNRKGTNIYLKALFRGKLVGSCSAMRGIGKESGNAELGIAIAKGWRGKGLGKVMLKEMIGLAKRRWKARNIHLSVFEKNKRARKLYASVGFREIARLPGWIDHHGERMGKLILVLKK